MRFKFNINKKNRCSNIRIPRCGELRVRQASLVDFQNKFRDRKMFLQEYHLICILVYKNRCLCSWGELGSVGTDGMIRIQCGWNIYKDSRDER